MHGNTKIKLDYCINIAYSFILMSPTLWRFILETCRVVHLYVQLTLLCVLSVCICDIITKHNAQNA